MRDGHAGFTGEMRLPRIVTARGKTTNQSQSVRSWMIASPVGCPPERFCAEHYFDLLQIDFARVLSYNSLP